MTKKKHILHKISLTFLKAWNKVLGPSPRAEVYLTNGDSILFVKNGNKLILPGGRLEPGERFEEAARRETKEETGIAVAILEQKRCYINRIGDIVLQFEAEIEDDSFELNGSWEGEPKWIEINNLKDYNVQSKI